MIKKIKNKTTQLIHQTNKKLEKNNVLKVSITILILVFMLIADVSAVYIQHPTTFDNGYYFVKDTHFNNSTLGWSGNGLDIWYNYLRIPDDNFAEKTVFIGTWSGNSPLLLTIETPTAASDKIDSLVIYDSNSTKVLYKKDNFHSIRGARIDYYIFKDTSFITIRIIDKDENTYDCKIKVITLYTPDYHHKDFLADSEMFDPEYYISARNMQSELGYIEATELGHNARFFPVNGIESGKRSYHFYMQLPSSTRLSLSYMFLSLVNNEETGYHIGIDLYSADDPYLYHSLVSKYEYLDGVPTFDDVNLDRWAGQYVHIDIRISWFNNTNQVDTGLVMNYLYIDSERDEYRYTPGEIINAEEFSKSIYKTGIATVERVYGNGQDIGIINERVLRLDTNVDGGYVSYLIENTIPIYESPSFGTDLYTDWTYDSNYTYIIDGKLRLNATHTTGFSQSCLTHLTLEDSYKVNFDFSLKEVGETTPSIFSLLFNYDNVSDVGYALQFVYNPDSDDIVRIVKHLGYGSFNTISEKVMEIETDKEYSVELTFDKNGTTVHISNEVHLGAFTSAYEPQLIGFMIENIIADVSSLSILTREPFAANRLHLRAMNTGPKDVTVAFYIDEIEDKGIARQLLAKMVLEKGKGLVRINCPINPNLLRFNSILSFEVLTPFSWDLYFDELGFSGATPFGQSRQAWDYYRKGNKAYINNNMLVYAGDENSGYEDAYDYTDSTNEIFYPHLVENDDNSLHSTGEVWTQEYSSTIVTDIFTSSTIGDSISILNDNGNYLVDIDQNQNLTHSTAILEKLTAIAGDIKLYINLEYISAISAEDDVQIRLCNNANSPFIIVGRKGNRYYLIVDGYEYGVADTESNLGNYELIKTNDTVIFSVDNVIIFNTTIHSPSIYQGISAIQVRIKSTDNFDLKFTDSALYTREGYTTLRHRLFEETFDTDLDNWNLSSNGDDIASTEHGFLTTLFEPVTDSNMLDFVSETGTGYHGIYLTHNQAYADCLVINTELHLMSTWNLNDDTHTIDNTAIGIQKISFGTNEQTLSLILHDLSETDHTVTLDIIIDGINIHTKTFSTWYIEQDTHLFFTIKKDSSKWDIIYTDNQNTESISYTSTENFEINTISISQETYLDHSYANFYVDNIYVDEYYWAGSAYSTSESSLEYKLQENIYESYLESNWIAMFDGCSSSDIGFINDREGLLIEPLTTLSSTATVSLTRSVTTDYDFTLDLLLSIKGVERTGDFYLSLNNMYNYLHIQFDGQNMYIEMVTDVGTDSIVIDKSSLLFNTLRIVKEGTTIIIYTDINIQNQLSPLLQTETSTYTISSIELVTLLQPTTPIEVNLKHIAVKDSSANEYGNPWDEGHLIINEHFSEISNWDISGYNYYNLNYNLVNTTQLSTNFTREYKENEWYGNIYSHLYMFQRDFVFDLLIDYLLDGTYGKMSFVLEDHLQYPNFMELCFSSTTPTSIDMGLYIQGVLHEEITFYENIDAYVFRIHRDKDTIHVSTNYGDQEQLSTLFSFTSDIEHIYIDRIKIKQLSLGKNENTHSMRVDAMYINAYSTPISNPAPFEIINSFVAPDYSTMFNTIEDFTTYTYGLTHTNDVPYDISDGLQTQFLFGDYSNKERGRTYWKEMVLIDNFLLNALINTTVNYNSQGSTYIEFLDNCYDTVFKLEFTTKNNTFIINLYAYDVLVSSYVDDTTNEIEQWVRFGRYDNELKLGLYRGDYYVPLQSSLSADGTITKSMVSNIFAVKITQTGIYTQDIYPNTFRLKEITLGSEATYDETTLVERESPEEENFIASYDMYLQNETRFSITATTNYYIGDNTTERLTFNIYLLEIDSIFDMNNAIYVGSIIFLDTDFDVHTHSLVIIGYEGLYEVVIMIDRRVPVQLHTLRATDIGSSSEAEQDYEYMSDGIGWADTFDNYSSTNYWAENVFTTEKMFTITSFSSSTFNYYPYTEGFDVNFNFNILRVSYNDSIGSPGIIVINHQPINVANYPFLALEIMTDELCKDSRIQLIINEELYDITPFTDRKKGFVTIHKNLYEILYPNIDQAIGQLAIQVNSSVSFTIRNIEVYKILNYEYNHIEEANEDSYADVGYSTNNNLVITFLIGHGISTERMTTEWDIYTYFKSTFKDVSINYFYANDEAFPTWYENTIENSDKRHMLVIFDQIPDYLVEYYYWYDNYGRPFEKIKLEEWYDKGHYLLWAGSQPFKYKVESGGSTITTIPTEIVNKYFGRVIDTNYIPNDINLNISSRGNDVGLQQYNPEWMVNASDLYGFGGLSTYYNATGVIYNKTEHGDLIDTEPLWFDYAWYGDYIGAKYGFLQALDTELLLRVFYYYFVDHLSVNNVFGNLLLNGPISLQKTFTSSKNYQIIQTHTSEYITVGINNQHTFNFTLLEQFSLVEHGINTVNSYSLDIYNDTLVSLYSIKLININGYSQKEHYVFDEPHSPDFNHNFVVTHGKFNEKNEYDMLAPAFYNGTNSAAYLDSNSFGEYVLEVEMSHKQYHYQENGRELAGIVIDIPSIDSENGIVESLFIGFKTVEDMNASYPTSLFVAKFTGSFDTYTVLYENKFINLGNSITHKLGDLEWEAQNYNIQPMKLYIKKSITDTNLVKYDIFAKAYRVFQLSAFTDEQERQVISDGEYRCKTEWFADTTSITLDSNHNGYVGIYGNHSNYYYNSLSIYPITSGYAGDYLNINDGIGSLSVGGTWINGEVSTNWQKMEDVNYLITLSNILQNVGLQAGLYLDENLNYNWEDDPDDWDHYIEIGLVNEHGHEVSIIWENDGFKLYGGLTDYMILTHERAKSDQLYKVGMRIDDSTGDVTFTIYGANDINTTLASHTFKGGLLEPGFRSWNEQVKLFVRTTNTMAYIDEVRNGKFVAQPLTYSSGRGLVGAGEISYWLKGQSEYSLELRNNSMSNVYLMGNYTEKLGVFTTTFALNGSTTMNILSSYFDDILFNISIIDNALYVNATNLNYILSSNKGYKLTYYFNSTFVNLTLNDITRFEELKSWEFNDYHPNIFVGYEYTININTTKGSVYFNNIAINTLNSLFTKKDKDTWVFTSNPLFSNYLYRKTSYLQLVMNPIFGTTNITVLGNGKEIAHKVVKYEPFATNHPVIIMLQGFNTHGLHRYTLIFSNVIEFDRIALGYSQPVVKYLYTQPTNASAKMSDSKYNIAIQDFNGNFVLEDFTIEQATSNIEFAYRLPVGQYIEIALPLKATFYDDYLIDSKEMYLKIILGDSYLDSIGVNSQDMVTTGFETYNEIKYYDRIKDDSAWHYYALNYAGLLKYINDAEMGQTDTSNIFNYTDPEDALVNLYTLASVGNFNDGINDYKFTITSGSSLTDIKDINFYIDVPSINPSENLPSILMGSESIWTRLPGNDLGTIHLNDQLDLSFEDTFSFNLAFNVKTYVESIGSLVIETNIPFMTSTPIVHRFDYECATEYEVYSTNIPIRLVGGYHSFIFRLHNNGLNSSISQIHQPYFKIQIVLDHSFDLPLNALPTHLDENNHTVISEWLVSNPGTYIDKTGEYFRPEEVNNTLDYIPIYNNNSMSYFLTELLEKSTPINGDIITNNITDGHMELRTSTLTEFGKIGLLGTYKRDHYGNNTQLFVSTTLYHGTDMVNDLEYTLHSNIDLSHILAIYVDGFLIRQPTDHNCTTFNNELLLSDENGKFKFDMKQYILNDTYKGDKVTKWHNSGFHTFAFILDGVNNYTQNFTVSIEGMNEFIQPITGPTDYHIDILEKWEERRIYLNLDEYRGGVNVPRMETVDVARRSYSSKKYLMSYYYFDGTAFHTVKVVWIGIADWDPTDMIGYAVIAYIYDQFTAHEYHDLQIQKIEVQQLVPCSTTNTNKLSASNLRLHNTHSATLDTQSYLHVSSSVVNNNLDINNVLQVKGNNFDLQLTDVGSSLTLYNVIDIEYWNVLGEHYHTGHIEHIDITREELEKFNATQFKIYLNDKTISINLLFDQVTVLGDYNIKYTLDSLQVEINNKKDGIYTLSTSNLLKTFTYNQIRGDTRTLDISTRMSARATLEEYVMNYDWEGAFIQAAKSMWQSFVSDIKYNVWCPIKQFYNVVQSGQLYDTWKANWKDHMLAYTIVVSIVVFTGALIFIGLTGGLAIPMFAMGLLKMAFKVAGILLIGMIILDCLGLPNFIGATIEGSFKTIQYEIELFFSDPGKYITNVWNNVLHKAKVIFAKVERFFTSAFERIKESAIGFYQDFMSLVRAVIGFLKGDYEWNEVMHLFQEFSNNIGFGYGRFNTKITYYLSRLFFMLYWINIIGGCSGTVNINEVPHVQSNTNQLLHLNFLDHQIESKVGPQGSVGNENNFMRFLWGLVRTEKQLDYVQDELWNNDLKVKYIAEKLRQVGFKVAISETIGANVSTVYVPSSKKEGVGHPDDRPNPSEFNQLADIVIYRVFNGPDEDDGWHWEFYYGFSDNMVLPLLNIGLGIRESRFMSIMESFMARFDTYALYQDVRDALFDPDTFFRHLAISQIPMDLIAIVSNMNDPSHDAGDMVQRQLDNEGYYDHLRKYLKEQVDKDTIKDPDRSSFMDELFNKQIEAELAQIDFHKQAFKFNQHRLGFEMSFGTYFAFSANLVNAFIQWGIFWPQTVYTTTLGTVVGLRHHLVSMGLQLFLMTSGISGRKAALLMQKTYGNGFYQYAQSFASNFWIQQMFEDMYDWGPAGSILGNLGYYGVSEGEVTSSSSSLSLSLNGNDNIGLKLETLGNDFGDEFDEVWKDQDHYGPRHDALMAKINKQSWAKAYNQFNEPYKGLMITEEEFRALVEENPKIKDYEIQAIKKTFGNGEENSGYKDPYNTRWLIDQNYMKLQGWCEALLQNIDNKGKVPAISTIHWIEKSESTNQIRIAIGHNNDGTQKFTNVKVEDDSLFKKVISELYTHQLIEYLLVKIQWSVNWEETKQASKIVNKVFNIVEDIENNKWLDEETVKEFKAFLTDEGVKLENKKNNYWEVLRDIANENGGNFQTKDDVIKDLVRNWSLKLLQTKHLKKILGNDYAEIKQKVLSFIKAMEIINNPTLKKKYLERMEIQIKDQFKTRGYIVLTTSEWLKLEIDPTTGELVDVKLAYDMEKNYAWKDDNFQSDLHLAISSLFKSDIKESVTGADAVVIGEKIREIKNDDGTIRYETEEVAIEVEMKNYAKSLYKPKEKDGNIIYIDSNTDDEVTKKVLKDLGIIKEYTGDSIDQHQNGYVPTYETPGGGVINVRNVIETFQKQWNIFPPEGETFTAETFKDALEAHTLELKSRCININLLTLFRKKMMVSNIKAMFQGEVALKTDSDGLVTLKDKTGTDLFLSITDRTKSLAGVYLKADDSSIKYTAYTEIFDGVKLPNNGEPITVTEVDGSKIYLSQYSTGDNVFNVRINGEDYKLSPAIFYHKDNKYYYVFKADGTIIQADTYKNLGGAINNEFTKSEYTSINDFRNNGLAIYAMAKGDTLPTSMDLFLSYRLQQILLQGENVKVTNGYEHTYPLDILNTAKLETTDENYAYGVGYVNAYLLTETDTRSGRDIKIEKTDHNKYAWKYDRYRRLMNGKIHINEWASIDRDSHEYRALMGGIDTVHMDCGLKRYYPELEGKGIDTEAKKLFDIDTYGKDSSGKKLSSLEDIVISESPLNSRLLVEAQHTGKILIEQLARYVYGKDKKGGDQDGTRYGNIIGLRASYDAKDKFFIEVECPNQKWTIDTTKIWVTELSQVIATAEEGVRNIKKGKNGWSNKLVIAGDKVGDTTFKLDLTYPDDLQKVKTYHEKVKKGKTDFEIWYKESPENKQIADAIHQAIVRSNGEENALGVTYLKKVDMGIDVNGREIDGKSKYNPYLPITTSTRNDQIYLAVTKNGFTLLKRVVGGSDTLAGENKNSYATTNLNNEIETNFVERYCGSTQGKSREDIIREYNDLVAVPKNILEHEPALYEILIKYEMGKDPDNLLNYHQAKKKVDGLTWEQIIENMETMTEQNKGRFDLSLLQKRDHGGTITTNIEATIQKIVVTSFLMGVYEKYTDYGRYIPVAEDNERFQIYKQPAYSWVLRTDKKVEADLKYKEYRQVFDDVNLWVKKQIDEKKLKGTGVLEASHIDEYITDHPSLDDDQKEILRGIQDCLEDSLFLPEYMRYTRREEENPLSIRQQVGIYLYGYIKASIALEQAANLDDKALLQFQSSYHICMMWQSVMEIGSSHGRFNIGNNAQRLRNLVNDLAKRNKKNKSAWDIYPLELERAWQYINFEAWYRTRRDS